MIGYQLKRQTRSCASDDSALFTTDKGVSTHWKAYRLLWLTDLVNFGCWGFDVDAVRFVVKFELFLQ